MQKKHLIYLSLFALFLTTLPLFFEIYRTAAFNTVSRNDYAPYLQALVGDGGFVPGSPFAYRILSVAAAIPFYYLIPTYNFSGLKNIDPAYLQATQALSFVSYLSVVLTGLVIYHISRRRYNASPSAAIITGFLSFFVGSYIERYMIDPTGVLFISLLYLYKDRPTAFIPLIFLSIGINEKIVITFACLFTFRYIQAFWTKTSFKYTTQLISSNAALLLYYLVRQFFFKLPGYEQQLAPGMFLSTIFKTIFKYTMSFKGMYLGMMPLFLLLVLFTIAYKYREQNKFQFSDISCIFVFLGLALVGDVKLNIGRIIMYTFPLYLPAISTFLDDVLNTKNQPKEPNKTS